MSDSTKTYREEQELLLHLREILLKEDREAMAQLRQTLHDPVWFAGNAMPLIEEHIEHLKKNFPKEFNKSVEKIVDRRLKESQSEILDTIYPVLGTMIKKYINHQFDQLKEAIDKRVKEALDTRSMWTRIKAKVFGIKSSELILSQVAQAVVEEIFVIQRDSGLLIGHASKGDTINRDAVAGMLTAIKAFVEDAFQREQEQLELISYASYKILMHNYHSYYIAVALSGSVSAEEQEKLRDKLQAFSRAVLVGYQQNNMDQQYDEISMQLNQYFIQTIY
jgi:hypothetical protein